MRLRNFLLRRLLLPFAYRGFELIIGHVVKVPMTNVLLFKLLLINIWLCHDFQQDRLMTDFDTYSYD